MIKLLAALCLVSASVLADEPEKKTEPRILFDCGSLAGEGKLLIVIGNTAYPMRIKCGREA